MPRPSRWLLLAVTGALLVSGTSLGPAASPAKAAVPSTCNTDWTSFNDFDGDGKADYVVGLPGEDLSGAVDAGRVEVHYGNGVVQGLALPSPARGDRFGTAVATFALHDGPCDGLLVGAPGRAVDGVVRAGTVGVFRPDPAVPGSRLAYRTSLSIDDDRGFPLEPEADFGASLSVGAAEPPGWHDQTVAVYVGAPGTPTGSLPDVGAVAHDTFTAGSEDQIVVTPHDVITAATADQSEPGRANDRFGAAIADAGRLIGAPGRTVNGRQAAGAVYDRYEDHYYRELTQDTSGVPGTAEAGDQFGAALLTSGADDVIGAPGESIGAATGAGMVVDRVFVGDTAHPHYRTYRQGADGVSGTPERGDHFGQALGSSVDGRFYIGVPGEDIGTITDAGIVQPSLFDGEVFAPTLSQNTAGVPGTAEAGDRFGATIGGWGEHLLIGVPGENAGAGLVCHGRPHLTDRWTAVHQASGAAEAGDGFGTALATYPW